MINSDSFIIFSLVDLTKAIESNPDGGWMNAVDLIEAGVEESTLEGVSAYPRKDVPLGWRVKKNVEYSFRGSTPQGIPRSFYGKVKCRL